MTAIRTSAYWYDGTAFCTQCVNHEDSPCLSDEEKSRASIRDGIGRCGCCGEEFEPKMVRVTWTHFEDHPNELGLGHDGDRFVVAWGNHCGTKELPANDGLDGENGHSWWPTDLQAIEYLESIVSAATTSST